VTMNPNSDIHHVKSSAKNKTEVYIRHCSVSFPKKVCPSLPTPESINASVPNYLERFSNSKTCAKRKESEKDCKAGMNDRFVFMTSYIEMGNDFAFLRVGTVKKFGQTCSVKSCFQQT